MDFRGGVFFQSNSETALRRVGRFGDPALSSLDNAYDNHSALQDVATDLPASVTTNPVGMEAWNTSAIDIMREVSASASSFDRDISGWDTSGVSTMHDMFYGADAFDQGVSGWDVSSVTEFYGMFRDATSYLHALENWNVSRASGGALGRSFMFGNAAAYSGDMSGWCVSGQAGRPADFADGSLMPSSSEPNRASCP